VSSHLLTRVYIVCAISPSSQQPPRTQSLKSYFYKIFYGITKL
jgi:hypothetical protein